MNLSVIKHYYWYLIAFIFTMMLQNYFQQFSRAIDKMVLYAISGVITAAVTAITSFSLIPKFQVVGLLLAELAGLNAAIVYLFVAGHYYRYWTNASPLPYLVQMLRYAIPLLPNILTVWIINILNRPLLETFIGVGGVGLFSIAIKLPTALNSLISILGNAWQISVMEEFHNPSYNEFYVKVLKLSFSLSLTLAYLGILALPLYYKVFIDDKYIDSMKYVPFLFLWSIFLFMSVLVGANFSAIKQSKYFTYSSVISAVVALFLNFTLIPLWGIAGAVAALIISGLSTFFLRLFFARKMVYDTNIVYYAFFSVTYLLYCFLAFRIPTYAGAIGSLLLMGLLVLWNKNDLQMIKCFIKKGRAL